MTNIYFGVQEVFLMQLLIQVKNFSLALFKRIQMIITTQETIIFFTISKIFLLRWIVLRDLLISFFIKSEYMILKTNIITERNSVKP